MRRAGYDPTEMVDVFDMLDRVTQASGGRSLPTWLSTHPAPADRREKMEQALAEAGGSFDGVVGRERYMEMIDGLVFGENARQGFFRGALFLHPELAFQMEFPAGWQTQNTNQAVFALSPDKDAVIQLSLGQGASIDSAAQSFLGQSGVRPGSTQRDAVNGLPAVWASFAATTSNGAEIRGLVVFLAYNDLIYQTLGYTTPGKRSGYDAAFRRTFNSFDRLTDPAALSVQPARIEVVRLDRAMTLEQFAERYPSSVPIATLELINGVESGATIPAGESVKRVVGGPPPED
jgi:predicted Zn-dependent protease